MAVATLVALDNALQTVYLPGMNEQFLQESGPLYQSLGEPTAENFQGTEIVHGIHVGRNPSFGARKEMEDLPEPGHQRYAKIRTGIAYEYSGISYTGQLIKQARTHPGAFLNVTQMEAPQLATDLTIQCNRQLFNDPNGYVCIVAGPAVGQVVPVEPSSSLWNYLNVGSQFDIGTAANSQAGAVKVTVETFDMAAGTITFVAGDVVSGVAAGHFVRFYDSYDDAAQRTKELIGLREIIDDDNVLFGLDPVDEPHWASYHHDSAGAASEQMFKDAIDHLSNRTGQTPSTAYTTYQVCQDMGTLMEINKRYVNTTQMDGGHSGTTVSTGAGTITLQADRFCPDGEAWFPHQPDLVWNGASNGWEWMQEDGAILNRIPRKDAYEAQVFRYWQLTTTARFRHGRISGIT